MNKQAGQALHEYIMIGVAVILLTIPALMVLRDRINEEMAKTVPHRKSSHTVAVAGSPTGGPGQIDSTEGQGAIITLNNGTTMKLPRYPHDIRDFVRTTGSNGATEVLANTLTDAAKQMLATREIDQAQYNNLVALANQGHKIASIEKAVQDLVADLPPGEKLSWDSPVTWEGQQVTAYDLYLKLGYFYVSKGELNTTGYLDATEQAGSDIKELQTLYNNALSSGALSDPTMQTMVSGLTTDIASMSYDFIMAMNQLTDGSLTPSNLNESLAAQVTDSHSARICNVGNAKDNGVHCSTN